MNTPPPWEFRSGFIVSEDETVIAEVHDADTFKRSVKNAADIEAEYEANGFILAAAPELLSAARTVHMMLHERLLTGPAAKEAIRSLEAAITKADGPLTTQESE